MKKSSIVDKDKFLKKSRAALTFLLTVYHFLKYLSSLLGQCSAASGSVWMYIGCTDISNYSKTIVIIAQKMDFGDLSKYVSFYKERPI